MLRTDSAWDEEFMKVVSRVMMAFLIANYIFLLACVWFRCLIKSDKNLQVIRSVLTGVLDVRPAKILATDKDSINAPIMYAFVNGTPASYLSYFLIDGQTGKDEHICGFVLLHVNWILDFI